MLFILKENTLLYVFFYLFFPTLHHQSTKIWTMGRGFSIFFLRNKGYRLLNFNYRYRRAEIDFIARKGDFICFIEVKIRNTHRYGYPEEQMSHQQKLHYYEASQDYMLKHRLLKLRFDILSIEQISKQQGYLIRHFQDAF